MAIIFWILIIFYIFVGVWTGLSTKGFVTAREFCLNEIVDMQCSQGEVLLVERAFFGRMRLGRCVQTDYGYLGCTYDVTAILAAKCSGRRHCRIFNLEVLFANSNSCPRDLKAYLDANFRCAKVAVPTQPANCLHGGHLTVQSSTVTSGLIASITAYEQDAGSTTCPWVIEASPGLRINLTLMDFSEYHGQTSSDFRELHSGIEMKGGWVCRELAIVEEERVERRKLVACNSQPRSSVVYSSKTNRVKISLSPRNLEEEHPQNTPHFLLKYDVYGCPYPPNLAPNTYFVENEIGDSVRIHCNLSDEFWTLHCGQNGTWNGFQGNCSTVMSDEMSDISRFSYGMSLLLVLIVAVSICFIFLSAGLLCLYRSKLLHRQSRTKQGFVLSMPSYSPSRCVNEQSKASSVSRSQSLGRPVYCPLDPKCTTLVPIDEPPPVFHTLHEPNRRPIHVSAPLMPRGQQMIVKRPPCTCSTRSGSVLTCRADQTRTEFRGQSMRTFGSEDDDCENSSTIAFTTFKPVSPGNEYGTPAKQRGPLGACHVDCCTGCTSLAAPINRPGDCFHETSIGNVTV